MAGRYQQRDIPGSNAWKVRGMALLLSLASLVGASETRGGGSFARVAGSSFSPLSSNTLYSTTTEGCIFRAAGVGRAVGFSVDLPDGTVIESFDLFAFDSVGGNDLLVELIEYDGMGGAVQLGSAETVNFGGSQEVNTGPIFHTVDNESGAIALEASFDTASPNLRVCGVRLNVSSPID